MENAPAFSGTYPAVSLALFYVLQGRPNKAERPLSATLAEYKKVLGKDDTTRPEYG